MPPAKKRPTPTETVQTTLRFPAEFHEKVRITIARRRMRSIQQAVELALAAWMTEDATVLRVRAEVGRQVAAAAKAAGVTLEDFLLAGVAALEVAGVGSEDLKPEEARYVNYAVTLLREPKKDAGATMALMALETVGKEYIRLRAANGGHPPKAKGKRKKVA